jgi:pSer/pThr/pTyr-binding forkhead associated (FHA) protein
MALPGDTQLTQTPRGTYTVQLQIGDAHPPQTVCITRTLLIGRSSRDHNVDIDLGDYDGYSRGVSRYHLRLDAYRNRLTASDLNSSNGTTLNGQPMPAYRAFDIQAGDTLCLGQMLLRVLAVQSLTGSVAAACDEV